MYTINSLTLAYNPITGLRRGELSARKVLVLFCVCFGGRFCPHSGEGHFLKSPLRTAEPGPMKKNALS